MYLAIYFANEMICRSDAEIWCKTKNAIQYIADEIELW